VSRSLGSNPARIFERRTVNMLSPIPTPPLRRTAWLPLLLTLLIAGCASPPAAPPGPAPAAPGGAAPAPSRPLPPTVSPLVSEQRWLDEWFRGTPVVIAMSDINTLTVDVPLANAFEPGNSGVKAALAAVLDRVATSLRRQPSMRLSIAAPPDAAGANAALASARADQVRGHLVSRGVPATRIAVGTARPGAPLQLRLLVATQAIGRLDDTALPAPSAPAAGTKR
jgi:outer membrane protein OmpA-like peptidoglycan-associated protein